jgi:endonuclease G
MLNTARLLRLALLSLLLAAGCNTPNGIDPGQQEPPGNPNIRFGMPAPAAAERDSRDAYLLDRPQYVLSYNAEKRTANWVCWRLRKEDIGNVARGSFEPDPDLPKGFGHVVSHSYDDSGFDRGHMCPAKDRSATKEDSIAVFYLTNIVPQAPNCNRQAWERMEDYCRRLARQGKVLYIACGPWGAGGEGTKGRVNQIRKGRNAIVVPSKLWKVVLVLPDEDAQPRRNSRVIAVIIPNRQSVGYDWGKYRVTAKDVEELTGFNFFGTVPEETRRVLVNHMDEVDIPVKTRKSKKKVED